MDVQTDKAMSGSGAGSQPARRWRRCLVAAGLLFFLCKGLLWLSLPGILLWWGSGS